MKKFFERVGLVVSALGIAAIFGLTLSAPYIAPRAISAPAGASSKFTPPQERAPQAHDLFKDKAPPKVLQKVEALRKRLRDFKPDPARKHDDLAISAIDNAIGAANGGNFGVGALLVEPGGVVDNGRNRVFEPYFRSDRHAEMDVLTNREERLKGDHTQHRGCVLITSLEPCPQCYARLISSGITEVYYVAADSEGGMVHLKDQMPNVWRKIVGNRVFAQADVSPELRDIAFQVFLVTVGPLDAKLSAPAQPAPAKKDVPKKKAASAHGTQRVAPGLVRPRVPEVRPLAIGYGMYYAVARTADVRRREENRKEDRQ